MKKIEMNVSMQRKLVKILDLKQMNNLLGLASCQKGSVNNE